MKVVPVGAYMFHVDKRTDGQTDMTKIIVFFFATFVTSRRN